MLNMARRTPDQTPGPNIVREETEAPSSHLGPGTGIHGALEIDGELVVAGRVRGKIAALRLVIAATGSVEGDIIATEVAIHGQFSGRIFAPSVAIEAGADVDGRIFHTNVTVARGARVSGRMPWRPLSYFENLDKLPEIRP